MRWLAFTSLVLLSSCGGYSERSYVGDGTLRDAGWYSGSGRYTLDLGDVDLTSREIRQYRMANLPPERLAVGLGLRGIVPPHVTIHLTLTHPSGTLIDETRPLTDWLVSSSRDFPTFLYCSGPGDGWSEEPGTAWGCIFKPEAGSEYLLTLGVVDASVSETTARLIVEGGPEDFLP
jgi:hypothetical protein